MTRTIWIGAVAYDPKVVTIWEGMRRYFHEEAHLPVEVVLFQSYEAQVYALLAGSDDHAPHIDIGWNTNLAYLQADAWSNNRCRPIAMRDTDIGWATKIVAVSGGPVATLTDLRNRTLALGSRDSGHAAILPVHFLEREGLVEQRDYRTLRFQQRSRQAWRYRRERGRRSARRPRRSRRCRRDRQPVLGESAKRAFGAGGGAARDLDFAAL
jgi:phosphonate transport system substrate-binding protein